MNPQHPTPADLAAQLRHYLALCEEVLALATRENQILASPVSYAPCEFHQQRKDLLPRLETAFTLFREWRSAGRPTRPEERGLNSEVKTLFQAIQNLVMRILLLDRENQQALLRRGLVPSQHLPPAAGQQPSFVASLYRRYSAV